MPSTTTSFWIGWLVTAFKTMPDFLGNNWIGFLFAFIFGFLYQRRELLQSQAFKQAVGWRQKLSASRDFAMNYWGSTFRLWFYIFLAFLAGHTLDLVFHRQINMETQNAHLSTQVASNTLACDAEKNGLIVSNATEKSRADTLGNQNRDQQNSINSCLNQAINLLAPVSQKFNISRSDWDISWEDAWKHHTQFIITTNLPAQGSLILDCARSFTVVDALIVGGGPRFPGSTYRISPHQWSVRIPSPQVTAKNPMLITLGYDAEQLGICTTDMR